MTKNIYLKAFEHCCCWGRWPGSAGSDCAGPGLVRSGLERIVGKIGRLRPQQLRLLIHGSSWTADAAWLAVAVGEGVENDAALRASGSVVGLVIC